MSTHRRQSKSYNYVLVEEDGQWSANYPDLHCWGVGNTRAMAIADLKDAARLMVEYLKEIGERVPPPRRIEVGAAGF